MSDSTAKGTRAQHGTCTAKQIIYCLIGKWQFWIVVACALPVILNLILAQPAFVNVYDGNWLSFYGSLLAVLASFIVIGITIRYNLFQYKLEEKRKRIETLRSELARQLGEISSYAYLIVKIMSNETSNKEQLFGAMKEMMGASQSAHIFFGTICDDRAKEWLNLYDKCMASLNGIQFSFYLNIKEEQLEKIVYKFLTQHTNQINQLANAAEKLLKEKEDEYQAELNYNFIQICLHQ